MASVGYSIRGSATSSTRTSRLPCQVTAFICKAPFSLRRPFSKHPEPSNSPPAHTTNPGHRAERPEPGRHACSHPGRSGDRFRRRTECAAPSSTLDPRDPEDPFGAELLTRTLHTYRPTRSGAHEAPQGVGVADRVAVTVVVEVRVDVFAHAPPIPGRGPPTTAGPPRDRTRRTNGAGPGRATAHTPGLRSPAARTVGRRRSSRSTPRGAGPAGRTRHRAPNRRAGTQPPPEAMAGAGPGNNPTERHHGAVGAGSCTNSTPRRSRNSCQPAAMPVHPPLRGVQLLGVGEPARGLHRHHEPGRQPGPPPGELRGSRPPVKAAVQFDGVEPADIMAESIPRRRPPRIQHVLPMAIAPPRGADMNDHPTNPHASRVRPRQRRNAGRRPPVGHR